MKLLAKVVFITIITLLLLEGVFRFVDPLGLTRYFTDLHYHVESLVEDEPLGIHPQGGQYRMSDWTLTVRADGLRAVPDSRGTDCTVAFVGDSIAFGWGVDDVATFANLWAIDHPSHHVINGAMGGYNIEQVVNRIKNIEADAYIYLVVRNDDELPYEIGVVPLVPSLYLYAGRSSITSSSGNTESIENFEEILEQLVEREDVIIFGFEGWNLSDKVAEAGGEVIPLYTDRISTVDDHPTAIGHREIYDAMRDAAETHVSQLCADV